MLGLDQADPPHCIESVAVWKAALKAAAEPMLHFCLKIATHAAVLPLSCHAVVSHQIT